MLAMTFQLHEISRKKVTSQILDKIRMSCHVPAYLYIGRFFLLMESYPSVYFRISCDAIHKMLVAVSIMAYLRYLKQAVCQIQTISFYFFCNCTLIH